MKVSEKLKTVLRIAFVVAVLATIGMFWYDEIVYYFGEEEYLPATCSKGSNVAVIKIYGDIVGYEEYWDDEWVQTSSDEVIDYLNDINTNDEIKAIIVEIDSWDGEPVAAEEICNALKRTEKPTIAVIKGAGVSAGYAISVGADRIYASRLSGVGSIGATMSYLDYTEKNKEEGIIYQQLSAGKFKDTGDPDKQLTEEERELLMRDINKSYRIFIELVAENRGLEIEMVEKLADGSTMLGEDAMEAGLIDEIGDIEDAKQYLRDAVGVEPVLCVFEE